MKILFEPGDIVKYSSAFLRSIGDYSHETASYKFEVISTFQLGNNLFYKLKDNENYRTSCLASNLVLASELHLEPR